MRQHYLKTILTMFISLLLANGWAQAQIASSNKMESQVQKNQLGRDPHFFSKAEKMFEVEAKKPFTLPAALLIGDINGQIESGLGIDSDSLFAKLLELNAYRCSSEVQAEVVNWIRRLAKKNTPTAGPRANVLFMQANEQYSKGRFDLAAENYRELLKNSPGHFDARNNLALTLIHQGKDLAAQVELEVILQTGNNYVPAMINLTVVYERIGQSAKAQQLAKKVSELQKNVPAAVYNNLWYDSLKENSPGLAKRVDDLISLSNRPLYRQLQRVVALGMNPDAGAKKGEGIWAAGLARQLWGKNPSLPKKVFAFLVFLLLALVLAFFSGTRHRNARLTFFILGSFLYFLYWGFSFFSLVGACIYYWAFIKLTIKISES